MDTGYLMTRTATSEVTVPIQCLAEEGVVLLTLTDVLLLL